MRRRKKSELSYTIMFQHLKSFAHGLQRAVIVVFLFVIASFAQGQSVTIDFTRTRETSLGIPWTEDGFTVASITQQQPFGGGLFVTAVSSGPVVGNPPSAGLLQFRAGSEYSFRSDSVSAILTNNLQQSFNLLSLDFYSYSSGFMAATNYARVYSSAGGSFDLLGTSNQTTLTFDGSAWRNLSYVKVDFIMQGAISSQLLLDNFVVQVNAVPEPGVSSLLLASTWTLMFSRIKKRRRNSMAVQE